MAGSHFSADLLSSVYLIVSALNFLSGRFKRAKTCSWQTYILMVGAAIYHTGPHILFLNCMIFFFNLEEVFNHFICHQQ